MLHCVGSSRRQLTADITCVTLKGPCLLGTSFVVGWLIRRFLPSSHMRSPSLYLGVSRCLTHDCCALIMNCHAWSRASLSWSRRNATCGNGDFPLVQSARRL